MGTRALPPPQQQQTCVCGSVVSSLVPSLYSSHLHNMSKRQSTRLSFFGKPAAKQRRNDDKNETRSPDDPPEPGPSSTPPPPPPPGAAAAVSLDDNDEDGAAGVQMWTVTRWTHRQRRKCARRGHRTNGRAGVPPAEAERIPGPRPAGHAAGLSPPGGLRGPHQFTS